MNDPGDTAWLQTHKGYLKRFPLLRSEMGPQAQAYGVDYIFVDEDKDFYTMSSRRNLHTYECGAVVYLVGAARQGMYGWRRVVSRRGSCILMSPGRSLLSLNAMLLGTAGKFSS